MLNLALGSDGRYFHPDAERWLQKSLMRQLRSTAEHTIRTTGQQELPPTQPSFQNIFYKALKVDRIPAVISYLSPVRSA